MGKGKDSFKMFSVLNENDRTYKLDISEKGLLEVMTDTCKGFFEDEKMIRGLRNMLNHQLFSHNNVMAKVYELNYQSLEKIIGNFEWGIYEVESFMNKKADGLMDQYKKDSDLMGAYMTVLINKAHNNEKKLSGKNDVYRCISLETQFFKNGVSLLGFGMEKNLMMIVNGNVDAGLGFSLNGGRIELIGNCLDRCGDSAKSGEIEVYGNTGDYLAQSLRGAKIIIHENCGEYTGHHMEQGRIEVSKDIESISMTMKGGTIIIDGKVKKLPRFFSDSNGSRAVWKKSNMVNKYKMIVPNLFKYRKYEDI